MRTFSLFLLIRLVFAETALVTNKVSDETILHRVGLGKIKGLRRIGQFDGFSREWYEFRGVRYSEEIERFDYPRYLDPFFWQGDYDATEYRSNCPNGFGSDENDENCLFLNIMIPDTLQIDTQQTRPVMIWLHGGGFMFGSGPGKELPEYQGYDMDGRGLALDQGVIVVNMNYRLGTLGFLSGIDDDHRGNFGLRDQQMAIQWVHQNIEYFGGDKDRITLFGCSAGGRSAGAQLMSSYNKGIIFGAISQSGGASADLMWDFHAEENRNQVFKSLECEDTATRLQCLRSKSVSDVQQSVRPVADRYREWQWGAIVDIDFFSDRCGYSAKTNGNNGTACYERVSKFHFMSGCCSADGYAFAPPWIKEEGQGSREKAYAAMSDYMEVYGYKPESFAGIKYAFTDWTQPDDDYSIRNLTVEAEADWRFCFPTLNMHHQRSKINGSRDSFLYYFDAPSDLLGGMQGANHCSDNKYEFGWPIITQEGPEEVELSRIMMQYWANFARTGNPNSVRPFKNWETFDSEKRNFMRFDLGDKTRPEDNFRQKWAAAWLDMMVEIENAT